MCARHAIHAREKKKRSNNNLAREKECEWEVFCCCFLRLYSGLNVHCVKFGAQHSFAPRKVFLVHKLGFCCCCCWSQCVCSHTKNNVSVHCCCWLCSMCCACVWRLFGNLAMPNYPATHLANNVDNQAKTFFFFFVVFIWASLITYAWQNLQPNTTNNRSTHRHTTKTLNKYCVYVLFREMAPKYDSHGFVRVCVCKVHMCTLWQYMAIDKL